MKRLPLLLLTLLALAAKKPDAKPFSVVEATIPEMQAALREGRVTSHDLVAQSLQRIATKDNIPTPDMPTTGGALAFAELVPPYEATITKNLRDAGAIIIAKTQMTELPHWVARRPAPLPA